MRAASSLVEQTRKFPQFAPTGAGLSLRLNFGQKTTGSFNDVVRHFASMIDGNLLVRAIEPLMRCEHLETIGLFPSTYGSNKGFAMAVLPDFSFGVAGCLVSSVLML